MIKLTKKEVKFLYDYQILCKDLDFIVENGECYMTNQKDYDFLKNLQLIAKNI